MAQIHNDSTRGLSDLVGKMTLDEKIMMLAAKNIWETPSIERLGIPSLKVRIYNQLSTSTCLSS
jgi:beta-glucosidase